MGTACSIIPEEVRRPRVKGNVLHTHSLGVKVEYNVECVDDTVYGISDTLSVTSVAMIVSGLFVVGGSVSYPRSVQYLWCTLVQTYDGVWTVYNL